MPIYRQNLSALHPLHGNDSRRGFSMICGHCKEKSKDLELFERNNYAAYTCPRCINFFNSFDRVIKEDGELLERLAHND
jgi:uncharacterized CHY-type Zn-finger protein